MLKKIETKPKQITLIKLGGSIITNKEVPMQVRQRTISRLIAEIAEARAQAPDQLYIIGHGQGSFAHAPALRYQTIDGFIHSDSLIGMTITQDSAAQLNRIVVAECVAQSLPAASYLPSTVFVSHNKQYSSWDQAVLHAYLENGILPVTCGDVIVDTQIGCTIWSTEKVFSHIAQHIKLPYQVKNIIHVTEIAGVLDSTGAIISSIAEENKKEVQAAIFTTKGFDVTGGMWHKIKESLLLAQDGITTKIISGLKKGNLFNCLTDREWIGTTIK